MESQVLESKTGGKGYRKQSNALAERLSFTNISTVYEAVESPQERKPRQVAVISLHGMGTHLPMSALKGAAVQVAQAARWGDAELDTETRLTTFSCGDHMLTRAEVGYRHKEEATVVSCFEAFYSPFLKGRAGVSDILSFLILSGLGRLKNLHLKRTVFGRECEFPGSSAGLKLWLTVLVIASVVLVNAAFIGKLAIPQLAGESRVGHHAAVSGSVLVSLALFALFLVLMQLVNAACMKARGAAAPSTGLKVGASVAYGTFMASLLSVVAAGLVTLLDWAGATMPILDSVLPGWLESREVHWILTLVFLLGSIAARGFLLNYAGDVVTYVFGYQSSKFYEVREAVLDRVVNVLSAVCKSGEFQSVIVFSHSLGTVVAYDAVNRYLLRYPAERRLSGLITYGSPLDKIAFIFRSESGDGDELRNALISSRQPLVNKPGRRKVPWWNVYGVYDIVAGKLDYFDPPDERDSPLAVKNREDRLNLAPVISHGAYWAHQALAAAMWEALEQDPDTA